jgi:hypothetical protein
MRLPDFLGLGGMRCGSSSLWHRIRAHPDVFALGNKELHFFSDRGGRFAQGVEAYARNFEGAKPGQLCGESTPEYLTVSAAAERIRRLIPEVRLFLVLRDPVERLWSHYRYVRNSGREPLSLERALELEPKRRASIPAGECVQDYLNRSLYIEHLRRFEALFGRDALLVILYEDFVADQDGVVARVAQHIGLDTPPPPATEQTSRRNVLESDVRSVRIDRLGRRLARWRLPYESSIPARVIRRAGRMLRSRNRLPRGRLRMNDTTRAELTARLEPSVRELERWLGRETGWCRS